MRLGWALQRLVDAEGYRPLPLTKDSKYTPGKRYWCGYWEKWYDVLAVEYDKEYPWRLKNVTVKWQDGRIGTHCTQLDPRGDYELALKTEL